MPDLDGAEVDQPELEDLEQFLPRFQLSEFRVRPSAT